MGLISRLTALASLVPVIALAAKREKVDVRGELIDTWRYYSGVMGRPNAVVGTAHHTYAFWCSARGSPWACWARIARSTWS